MTTREERIDMEDEVKKKIRKEGTVKLQGKEYLQVAPRVLLFRTDHPEDWAVITQFDQVGEHTLAKATVVTPDGKVLATAHKMVKPVGEGKGAARDYPFETAETGAVGRALSLCGYGTLSGDLDEGDQIADAPVTKGKW